MVIAQPITRNVSCKLHPYSLHRTRSPPEPRLPRRIGNTHLRNYYNLKGKDIVYIFLSFFLIRGIIFKKRKKMNMCQVVVLLPNLFKYFLIGCSEFYEISWFIAMKNPSL